MAKIEECERCKIKFYDIGNLKAKVRVNRHMKTLHTIPCEKCEKTFVSLSHKAFHEFLSHNLGCPHCNRTCEGHCSSCFSAQTEKVGAERMEMTKQGITKMVNHSESLLEEVLASITANQLEVLEYCANYIDTGHINYDSTRWAMMMYFPSPAMPVKKMNSFNYWYIPRSLHVSSN